MSLEFIRPPSAPVFCPSEEEFCDPITYVKKITPVGRNYGICKIRPPKGWRPPFAVDSRSFTFVPRVQDLADVCAHNRVKSNFITSLINFWEAQEVNLFEPQIKGKTVDLFKLWKLVKSAGDYQSVCEKKIWCHLCDQIGLPSTPAFASALCSQYKRILLPYISFLEREKVSNQENLYSNQTPRKKPTIMKMVCSVCGLGDGDENLLLCDGCETSGACHTYCLTPPLSDVPKGSWYCHSCVVRRYKKLHRLDTFGFKTSTTKYTLHRFEIRADEFKLQHFGKPTHMVSLEEGEAEFWRLVNSDKTEVSVEYGADLNANEHGSGFPIQKSIKCNRGKCYVTSPWNLNNTPVLDGSALRFLPRDVSGMIVPWCYVGMAFSCFCWHTEDHWSYSINYLHTGEAKTWYGVPTKASEKFEAAMRSEVPELFADNPDLLHHMTTMLSPNKLEEYGVPVYRLDQMPGEFVVTFPRAYHAGFNQGFNFAEAVNFCPPDWFEFGQHCIEHYAVLHRSPVFSHAELLCRMAESSETLSVEFLTVVAKQLGDLLITERSLRRHLARIGIRRTERMVFEDSADEKRECDLCKTTLYLSSLVCQCSDTMVCLAHYQIRNCCSREDQIMRYRYDLDELTSLKIKLQSQLEEYERWQSRLNSVFKSMNQNGSENLINSNKLQNMSLNYDELSDQNSPSVVTNPDCCEKPDPQIIEETKSEEHNQKLTLPELQDLLNIGQMRHYPDESIERLEHIVNTVRQCSSIMRYLLRNFNSMKSLNFSFSSKSEDSDSGHGEEEEEEEEKKQKQQKLKMEENIISNEVKSSTDTESNRLDDNHSLITSSSDPDESTDLEDIDVNEQANLRKSTRSVKLMKLLKQEDNKHNSSNRNKTSKCRNKSLSFNESDENNYDLKGPIISRLSLNEFNELTKLASNLPTYLPELDHLQQFATHVSSWRSSVRDLLTCLNNKPLLNDITLNNEDLSIDIMKLSLGKTLSDEIPSVSKVEQLIKFASTIDIELPELRQLRRVHECLTWLEDVENTLKQANTCSSESSDPVEDIRKPSLERLYELQMKGNQVASAIAYVTNLDTNCPNEILTQTTLDATLASQGKRLLAIIYAAKSLEKRLSDVTEAKPHSISLVDVEVLVTEIQQIPVWLPLSTEINHIYEQAQKHNRRLDIFEKLLTLNPKDWCEEQKNLSEDKELTENLGIGTANSTPKTWLSYFYQMEEKMRDFVIRFPQVERIGELLSTMKEYHDKLEHLFLRPSSNTYLLEILLPRSAVALEWLICLDGGSSELPGSSLNDSELVTTNPLGNLKRQARSSNYQASTYRSMCKENALEFAKILNSTGDFNKLYDSAYHQFVESELSLMQCLRNTNMKKSRAKNQEKIVYCICRQPGFTGFMLQCELCRDWVHGRCVTLPNLKESETERMRYICPRCECSLRPDLILLLNLLSDWTTFLSSVHSCENHPHQSNSLSSTHKQLISSYQFPEFVAAQLLCERAFMFIQHIRMVITSNPELHRALLDYERFSGARMPLVDCVETNLIKSEESANLKQTESIQGLSEYHKKTYPSHTQNYPLIDNSSNSASVRSDSTLNYTKKLGNSNTLSNQSLRDWGSKSTAINNSSSYMKSNRVIPTVCGSQRMSTNSGFTRMNGCSDSNEFNSADILSSSIRSVYERIDNQSLHKSTYKTQMNTPTLNNHDNNNHDNYSSIISGEVKEAEAAEALAGLSAAWTNSTDSGSKLPLIESNRKLIHKSFNNLSVSSTEITDHKYNQLINRKKLISSREQVLNNPYRSISHNSNQINRTNSLLSSNARKSQLERISPRDLHSNRPCTDTNINLNSTRRLENIKPENTQKFYFPLSPEARKQLEHLIMEACLLEVSLPQTRWLWQLHLASDPEIESNGAWPSSIAKLEENRLKKRILRHLHQMQPSHLSARLRAVGRKKRLSSEEKSEQLDSKSVNTKDDQSDSDSFSQSNDTSKRRCTVRDLSSVSSHSSGSELAKQRPQISKRRPYRSRGRVSDTLTTRRYKLGRPRRFHSVRIRRAVQRSVRAIGFRSIRNYNQQPDSSPNLTGIRYTSYKRRFSVLSNVNRKFTAHALEKRVRNLSGQSGTLPRRTGRVRAFHGERLMRASYHNSNDDDDENDDNVECNDDIDDGMEAKHEEDDDEAEYRSYVTGSDEMLENERFSNERTSKKSRSRQVRMESSSTRGRRPYRKRGQHTYKRQTKNVRSVYDGDSTDEQESSIDEDECAAQQCLNPCTGTVEWIACDSCGLWFHQICVGIRYKTQVPELYICPSCRRYSNTTLTAKRKQMAPNPNIKHLTNRQLLHKNSMRTFLSSSPMKLSSHHLAQKPVGWGARIMEDKISDILNSNNDNKEFQSNNLKHSNNFSYCIKKDKTRNPSIIDDQTIRSTHQTDHWADLSHSSGMGEPEDLCMKDNQQNFTSGQRSSHLDMYDSIVPNRLSHSLSSAPLKGPTEVLLEAIEVFSGDANANGNMDK